jgi:hypothetical protein
VRIELAPGTAEAAIPASIHVAALNLPAGLPAITDLRLRCPALAFSAGTVRCPGGRLAFHAAGRAWRASVDGHFDRRTGRGRLALSGLDYGGGTVDVDLQGAAGDWWLRLDARGVAAGAVVALLPEPPPWRIDGEADLSLRVDAPAGHPDRLRARLAWRELAFSSADGLQAGERLGGSLNVDADLRGDRRFELRLTAGQGQAYLDPVFIDLARHPLTLTAAGSASPEWRRFKLAHFELDQTGVGSASGSADLSRSALARFDAEIETELQLPGAYTVYAQPFLIGTAVGDLATDGTANATLALGAGTLNALQLRLDAVEAIDRAGQFGLRGVTGTLKWSAQDSAEPGVSTMTWLDGRVHGLALGAATARFMIQGDDFRLTAPLQLPVLDAALEVREFTLTDVAGTDPTARLDAELRPVSLAGVTRALGWPALTGSISGRLPRLEYRDGVATLGGELRINALGGTLRLEDLRLADPFGPLPELTTSVRLRGLSLDAVTQAFSFGRITGTLDGDIENLRLLGWQPAAFDAWLRTRKDDPRPHRISQRAVRNLASLGGGGGAVAALSRGFLQFFRSFDYDRIGLGCRLQGTVCRMRGLEPAEGGYLIVRGRGLPHIDVVGFNREVSWPTLVRQLIAATRGEGPVVK